MIAYLFQGIGYGFVGAAEPGPFQTFIISQTLKLGWRRTLRAVFAPLLTDAPIIMLVLLVLSQVPASFQSFMYIASGIFLEFLAWHAWRSWRWDRLSTPASPITSDRTLLKAMVINLLSPGPYAYWALVAGPTFLAGWRHAPATGIAFLLGFYGALVSTLATIIITFGVARQFGPRVTHSLIGVSIIALVGFGIYQFYLGALGFMG